jgi:hypothetical protein
VSIISQTTMKFKRPFLLVALTVCFVTNISAQAYKIKNGIAIQGGITQFDISTDNFVTKKGNGFIGGMAATVDLPHKWYTVSYGMLLSENNLEISGRMTDDVAGNEMIAYKLMTVQVGFLFHAKILEDNLTIDLGPQLQYNAKLELKDSAQETYFINGYNALMAKDITDISQFNVNGVVGISAGIGAFRIRAQYGYGLTNIFSKLNNNNLNTIGGKSTFKGNQQLLSLTAMITL